MDEREPLSDEVLAEMEATARASVAAHPDSGDVVRVGWDDLYSLITEVRRQRAERVRWEALRVAAGRLTNDDRQWAVTSGEKDDFYLSIADWRALVAAVAAMAT